MHTGTPSANGLVNLFSFKMGTVGVNILCIYPNSCLKPDVSRLTWAAVHLLVLYYMIFSGPED